MPDPRETHTRTRLTRRCCRCRAATVVAALPAWAAAHRHCWPLLTLVSGPCCRAWLCGVYAARQEDDGSSVSLWSGSGERRVKGGAVCCQNNRPAMRGVCTGACLCAKSIRRAIRTPLTGVVAMGPLALPCVVRVYTGSAAAVAQGAASRVGAPGWQTRACPLKWRERRLPPATTPLTASASSTKNTCLPPKQPHLVASHSGDSGEASARTGELCTHAHTAPTHITPCLPVGFRLGCSTTSVCIARL
jgi:hypothetical protein